MEEEILNSEEEEVATQEIDSNDLQHSEKETQKVQPDEKEMEQERNWRAMRQRQKEMEYEIRQRDEMLAFYKSNQSKPVEKIVEEPEIDDSEYVAAGGVKGIARKTVQPLEKKIQDLEARLAEQDQTRLIGSLRSKYTDFDDVVNVETLEILEKTEPELAATIAEFKDPYKMGIQSYKYIKALGLAEKLPSSRRVKEIEKKIESNSKTAQSPQAFDKRPMAQAFKSTAADQKRLYEEMMHFAGMANGL